MEKKLSSLDNESGENSVENAPSTKEFTLEELAVYNGMNGNPPYAAVNNIVYDMSGIAVWNRGSHFGLKPGADLTKQFTACHNRPAILNQLPVVGTLKQGE